MSRPNRLRRSELSTPGASPTMIAKAAQSEADLVFLDLEDAVSPSAKEAARHNIVAGLVDLDWGKKTRAVRVNSMVTQWGYDDLTMIVGEAGAHLDVIILPKVKSVRDVSFVDDLLTQLERRRGLDVGRIGLEVLIEEAEALSRVEEIAACSARLEALILGVGDLSASQGIRTGHVGVTSDPNDGEGFYPPDLWHYARNRVTVAARANGLDAIDGPYADFQNPSGYRREASWSGALGAVGKWCIHPNQIPIANVVYAPTQSEVEYAQKIVSAVRDAERDGLGAASLDGMMMDAATTRNYEVVLERARLCGIEVIL